ncbi:MAG: UvrD-helicase domain-containing protein [Bacteroidales bacterium]|nr:UvrD-helicase domain-containing protein [Bacteroidales bacterium]
MSPLNIYKASAGSGKTFALTLAYLKLLYARAGIHRHILAVTFTNKAAGEMKQRILGRLHCLSRPAEGGCDEEMKQLKEATGLDELIISRRAGELLHEILNDYSGFSVGTIDKFFQSVIRAFTHEIGIQPGYNLELDHRRVLSLAVDSLFQDLGNHPELQKWLIRYAMERMESSLSWDFRREMIQLGEQLFKESFQELFLQNDFALLEKSHLDLFLADLRQLEEQARQGMMGIATQALGHIVKQGVTPEEFKGAGRSPATIFVSARDGKDIDFTASKIAALEQAEKWLKKGASEAMEILTTEQLIPLLNQIYGHQETLNTIAAVRANFYALGILGDIREYVQNYTSERNLFLIADSGRFLRGIIGGNQVPFVYERTGNRFSHIMLDEFQDTSLFQYDNFRPLLDNSLAAGEQSLVVGDVKQSIYRWRNSDWKILASELEADFGHQEIHVEPLKENYRSREQVVRFNNTVFQLSSRLLSEIIEDELHGSSAHREEADMEVNRFRSAWKDVVQQIPDHLQGTGGRVRAEMFDTEETPFREQVLHELPAWVDEILETGIEPGEIAILVRTRKEGIAVANKLLEHARSSGNDRQFRLVSNDSLLLGYNTAVSLLISTLRYLLYPDNEINNALLKYHACQAGLISGIGTGRLLENDLTPEELLSDDFISRQNLLKQLPLFELIESMIDLLGLGNRPDELPYLQALQDLVIDLQRRGPVGIGEFLEYWEQTGAGKSISFSETSNAIRIITIHKAKGLEFKAVVVPFCDWDLTTDARNINILWCKTSGTPLERIPVVPVRFSSKMSTTLFSGAYYTERMKGYMDRLNLMYVAFTRARDMLYIGIPLREVKGVKNTGDLMQVILDQHPGEQPCTGALKTSMKGQVISLGKMPRYKSEPEKEDPWKFVTYPVNRGKRLLKVRLRSDQYFVDEEGVFRTGRMYGNMMHQLFSKIDTVDDVDRAVDILHREGLLPEKERELLAENVREMIGRKGISDWFSPSGSGTIFKERSLLCSEGEVLRPDRVIVEGDRATVVDFKFGELEKPSYHRQVSNYMEQLKKMGFKRVEGYLWYVMLDLTVKIETS